MPAGTASACSIVKAADVFGGCVIDGAADTIDGAGESGSPESPHAPAINNTETTAACITRSFK